ncbi:hypothetical protein E0E50_20090 [Azotobacter chroococcum subsp. isscasi]|uniref:hypothetical protein n=1 Tax=Azotobacter chroococcum TaxID=353 RepID=UPI00103AF042|nr:hypothetical protein [Azotobacter chroococcum]TBW06742.1 hypothetical protein E0E50_20090 [Azotobacter chroococcum subsp. isscasi]
MKECDTKTLTAHVLLTLAIYGCANVVVASEAISSGAMAEKTTEVPPLSVFTGRWSPDCEKVGGINIYHESNILIEVNSNQIYIKSHGEQSQKILSIFLDEPNDLGRGGMMLPWDEFSNEKSIAKMVLSSEKHSQVYWYGFYNKETNAYEWTTEPDFLGNTLPVIFNKCK